MVKKLPRRTMSMAKRANATAEAAADLDLVEDAIGTEEENAERFTTSHLALGMFAAFAAIVLLMGGAWLLFGSQSTAGDFSMLPDGYRESVGLSDPSYQGNGRAALPSAPRSPFPSAQQEIPIILAVTCPDGTVQIATGENVADTLCVRGKLVTGTTPEPTPTPEPETVRIVVVSVEPELTPTASPTITSPID
jgi:hypothetical protein